jgi:hypothetical protein
MASASLPSILQRAARGGAEFSLAERALFMACEFWSAIAARRLAKHLGAGAIDTLRYMNIIYSAIGAHEVASAVIVAVGEFEAASSPQGRLKCLTGLQDRLLRTKEPVDHLIARLARNLGIGDDTPAEWTSAPPLLSLSA